nr:hypothetical protein [Deltaproteobacteria bacterium]
MEMPQDAAQAYRQLARSGPDQRRGVHRASAPWAATSGDQESIERFRQALRIRPNDARAHLEARHLYAKLGRPQEAVDSLGAGDPPRPSAVGRVPGAPARPTWPRA